MANYQKGDIIRGIITGYHPKYGIFVKTKDGTVGLIRKGDFNMSAHNFPKGNYIDAIVKAVQSDGKLQLSHKKYLQEAARKRKEEEAARKRKEEEDFRAQLKEGDIVEAEVVKVDDKRALINIIKAGVKVVLPREELSPNKVIRASDEVFAGEHIRVVFKGREDDKMLFGRKELVKDRYKKELYDLPLMDLLATMGLKTTRYRGKCSIINNNYYLTNLMSVDEEEDDNDGKLLIDPINGRSLFVIIDSMLQDRFVEGEYHEVDIDLEQKEKRLKEGTPYMFCVVTDNVKKVANPYKEVVNLSFKQHTSPNTNESITAMLEEVGQNLYSSKKRMFFELLQNADDEASQNGVKVMVQIKGDYFVLVHDGFAFNRQDFESLASAAQSAKSADRKKTGYKGIGFKSVFTNSDTVLVKSCGFTFRFDKNYGLYNDFDKFYFYVNDIENDLTRQEEFIKKFKRYKESFNGVKTVPWSLLPIWTEDPRIDEEGSIFNERVNVAIALRMTKDKLEEYNSAVKEVFTEPRFMLFLRNTSRLQHKLDGQCLTIQKEISDDGKKVSLIKSFGDGNREEEYAIYTIDDVEVSDGAFSEAGIRIKKRERTNNLGKRECYFERVDEAGVDIGEVAGIPNKIASSNRTTVSFAIKLDKNNRMVTLGGDETSFYVYLPMNERRFKFPFFINADFIPKSDREGVQSDNPWNHFLFYTIGKHIVTMVADKASTEEPEYLNLLLQEYLKSDSQDTAALTEAFNRGYKAALKSVKFILDDKGDLESVDDIVYDESGLAKAIGNEGFYTLTGTSKKLPNTGIKSGILTKEIFNIERCDTLPVIRLLTTRADILRRWLVETSDEERKSFYEWIMRSAENNRSWDPWMGHSVNQAHAIKSVDKA